MPSSKCCKCCKNPCTPGRTGVTTWFGFSMVSFISPLHLQLFLIIIHVFSVRPNCMLHTTRFFSNFLHVYIIVSVWPFHGSNVVHSNQIQRSTSNRRVSKCCPRFRRHACFIHRCLYYCYSHCGLLQTNFVSISMLLWLNHHDLRMFPTFTPIFTI